VAKALGASVTASYDDLLRAWVPVAVLHQLASHESIRLLRRPLSLDPLAVVSEGVGVGGVAPWRSAGYTGAGVKIAVIDTGFQGYKSLLGTELPFNVMAESFREDDLVDGVSEHGTAAAEIVHDMAPGAELLLVVTDDELSLAQAVPWCQ
jgi:subtilisin family serine protease